MPEQPQNQTNQPLVVVENKTTADRVIDGAKTIAGLTPQGINNVILFILAGLVGMLIYVDRRDRSEEALRERTDRSEQVQMILRHNESQSELNRQVIVSQTQMLQGLSVQMGELKQVVHSLNQSVTALQKGKDPENEVFIAPHPKVKSGELSGQCP